jgi:hypothetical protein
MSAFLKLTDENWKSAVVYGLLWGLLAVLLEVQSAGSIYKVDWKMAADSGIVASIAFAISVIKNLLTTKAGKFLGMVKVIPEVKKDGYL